jgi:hypothetical protein
MGEPVLCYVKNNKAYFTTQELSKQRGDDWDDAPYEHNAGPPYTPAMRYYTDGREEKIERDWNTDGSPKWEIIEVMFGSGLVTPEEWHHNSSPYSVDAINAKYVPWLCTPTWSSDPKVAIHAGTTVSEFKKLIRQSGGKIYVKEVE